MNKLFLILSSLAIISVSVISCGDKIQAKSAADAQTEAQASADAIVYQVDTASSNIVWGGGSPMGSHDGLISLKVSELSVKDGKLEAGKFTADLVSLRCEDLKDNPTMAQKLANHLKDTDFLDVQKFSTATFTLTGVKELEIGKPLENEYNKELQGNLEFKGISKNLTIKANETVEGSKITIRTEKFGINRQDFGITYSNGETKDKIINDIVDLQVNITANKK
ncbi:MAG: YceI family protein [Flavobacteriaceae bacterium]|jgi:polyisoprenoid-binding protein YceI|nr:YceI family protein [Flavobacteriaceae bacterium]